MNKKYEFFGYCRKLQDDEIVSWHELEEMKSKSKKVSFEYFSKKTGFKFGEENECYFLDPSFGCFKSVLQNENILYWQYAGFEYIYKLQKT